jgi:LAS superfamily LD-carboxypeptidase LdcB
MIDSGLILGVSAAGLVQVPALDCWLHPFAVPALQDLNAAASAAGFDMKVASSYRNFDRQLLIWNAKAEGARPVLDAKGQALDITLLSDKEKIFAIMRWSALPGASRHHWGTDLDVYDASRIDEHYQLQLTLEETQSAGPFAAFHQWLTDTLKVQSHGFFRPYYQNIDGQQNTDGQQNIGNQQHLGGIAPEPWHLSYAPIANLYAAHMSETLLREQIEITDILLKDVLLENFTEIYQYFIQPYCAQFFSRGGSD